MKKRIIIFCTVLITLSLSAYSVINWDGLKISKLETSDNKDVASNETAKKKMEKRIFSDFVYGIGPRFGPIKKGIIEKATTINDFFDSEQLDAMVNLKSVSIILIIKGKQSEIRKTGFSKELTTDQLELLRSSDYSTNFLIRADYEQRNKHTGELEDSYSTPHLTIVPEKQAEYVDGNDNLKNYLKESSKEARVNVDVDKLQPAKLFFTVTKNGTIENVHLDRTSNYPVVDKKMIELITNLKGEWNPAENNEGEKVDQELVVSFGLMGC